MSLFRAPIGSLLKQPKGVKPVVFKPVSTKPVKPIRAKNPNAASHKREGNCAKHKALIKQMPCAVPRCRNTSVTGHHLKMGGARLERGAGLKATDQYLVPLCDPHHTGPHGVESVGSNNEIKWFVEHGVADVLLLARKLWEATGDLERMIKAWWTEVNKGAPKL